MHISFWQLGWRSLRRDLRAGELGLLIVAVSLAVAVLTAVNFFTERLQRGMQRDALQLLGGDAVLVSDNPPPDFFAVRARELGLQVVSSLGFPTMARGTEQQGGVSKLVALKAVQAGYPLRGKLRISAHPGGVESSAVGIPPPGLAWVDAALLDALELGMGDTLLLGASRLRIGKIIVGEPDRGASFLNLAPRVMINQLDVAATGLVQPASRLSYRMALAGEAAAVAAFVDWAAAQIREQEVRGVRLESLESGRPEMAKALERAAKFMNLVAMLAALLSALAVGLAAHNFAQRKLDQCALLRVLGLPQSTLAGSYAFEFALVGLLASGLGVLSGYAIHHAIVLLLAGLVEADLPAAGLAPLALGLGTGLVLLLTFGLPPVLQLARVPALRVIRREVGPPQRAALGVLIVGLLGFAFLLLVLSQDLQLGLLVVGAYFFAGLLFAALGWLALRLLRSSVSRSGAPNWLVLATRQLTARPLFAVLQISALGLSLMALLLLVLLRADLLNSWRNASPTNAPNRFVINIMPLQSPLVQQSLQAAGVERFDWYPMFRGRLVAVNGQPVTPEDFTDDRAKRLLDREFNLSHRAVLPSHNQVLQGRWTEGELGALSLEQGVAKILKLQLGDRLRFDVGGVQTESRITSLRKVDWASMRANFLVLYPLDDMPNLPVTYMGAFKAPDKLGFDHQLVRDFPNITLVDMSASLQQIERVMNQVILAVEFLFAFTLATGIVLLLALFGAGREHRAREFALMRAMGASAKLLRQVQRAELTGVGLVAGLLAALLASSMGWALAKLVFEFDWAFSPGLIFQGTLAGALSALVAGWWALRGVLLHSVVQTLREAPE